MTDSFSGYVLAGGKSSRMGADKAFLEFCGKTFIARAVETLSEICPVKIVLNRSQKHFIEKLTANTSYIFDTFENRGALGGIHAAFQDCETEFAVILAVDLPFVTGEAIKTIAETALDFDDFSAFVPLQPDGRKQPLCAVYRVTNSLLKIEDLLKTSLVSPSVRDYLELVPTKYIELNQPENLLFNVNRPNDFRHIS